MCGVQNFSASGTCAEREERLKVTVLRFYQKKCSVVQKWVITENGRNKLCFCQIVVPKNFVWAGKKTLIRDSHSGD